MSLVVHDGHVTGTVRTEGRLYKLEPLPDGLTAVIAVDQRRFPPEHPPGFRPIERQGLREPDEDTAQALRRADTGAEYTAIVAYTAAVKAAILDVDGFIQLAADETNQGYAASGVNTRIRIVAKYQTGYVEGESMEDDLTGFRVPGDGSADEIHAQRDSSAADIALLLLDRSDFCGIAAAILADASTGFAVVARDCATGYYSFAHEIGHLQGARHNPEVDSSTFPFPYGHGYRYDSGGWRTIMAYACPVSCVRLNRWANPTLTYNGVPTGTAAVSHDARVLNETAVRIANFRTGGSTGPVWHTAAGRGGSVTSAPECDLYGPRVDCFARTSTGTVAWSRSLAGEAWSGWTDLGGSATTSPECLVRGSRIDCFVTTTASRLAHITTFDGVTWSAWADRGGTVTSKPSCVAASSGAGLDCFALGTDKALYRLAFDGTAWKPWQKLGGSSAGGPACVRRGAGIDCFIVDAKKKLLVSTLSGTKWSKFKSIGSGIANAPQCLATGNKLDCFTWTSTGQLSKGWYDGSKWKAWQSLGGSLGGQPYCLALASNFECYYSTTAGTLAKRERRGTVWQPELSLGGAVQQRPTCFTRNGGARIDCFVRGRDSSLQQIAYY